MAEINGQQVFELATKAGKILLESGAEIFRVEETMRRIMEYYGIETAGFAVMGNAIIATCNMQGQAQSAKIEHIPVSSVRLDKITEVNQLSREIEKGKYTCEQAWKKLETIEKMEKPAFWLQVLASGMGSACFCALLRADFMDCVAVCAVSMILYFFMYFVSDKHLSRLVGNLCSSALIALLCILCCRIGFGKNLGNMVVGSITLLIPGAALTSGIRDMTGGDYISGTVRLLDALLGFISIAVGVGVTFAFCRSLWGGILL